MKKTILAIPVFLAAFLLCSCVSAGSGKEPQWVSKPEDVYPSALYLSAVGYASSRKAAEDAAFASLAAYIQQDLSVKSVSIERAGDGTAGFTEDYQFNRQVDSASSIKQLVGAGIQESWHDSAGTFYALAILNKKQASSYYTDQIKLNNQTVGNLISIAHGKPASFEAYSALKAAVPMAENNSAYLAILACTDPARRALLQTETVGPVQLLIAAEKEAQKIALTVTVSGDIDGRIASGFINVFRQLGVKVQNGTSTDGYAFTCDVRLDTLPPTADKNVYVRYTLTGTLSDTRASKTAYTFTFTGKDGHISENEAQMRCLRTIENHINTQFAREMTAALVITK